MNVQDFTRFNLLLSRIKELIIKSRVGKADYDAIIANKIMIANTVIDNFDVLEIAKYELSERTEKIK